MIWLGARQQVAAMPMRLALAWPSPAFICFVLGLLGALSMAVLTPPFQVPDESQHFHRAFQLSELEFHSMVRDGAAGAVLPSSLPELTETFLGTRAIHASRPITDQKLTRTAGLLSMPLSPDRREFVDFTGSAFYSPLPYVPQALAIAAGRLAGAGPLELLYLARIANALVAVSVLALAVGLLPLGREVAMVGGLLPMAIFEYGSVSPDAGVICTAFLFTALMTRGVTRGAWTAGEVAGATLCGLVFCSLKPVYAPLILLGLPLALDRGRVKHVLFVHALLIVLILGGTIGWILSAPPLIVLMPGASVSGQIGYIATHPLAYASVIARSLWHMKWFYYRSGVGLLGWLKLELPVIAYMLPVLALLLGVVAQPGDAPRLRPREICWNLVLLAGSVLLTMTTFYLYWTTVGGWRVEGIQGRYFIPLLALAAVTVCSVVRLGVSAEWSRTALVAVSLVVAVELLTADIAIVRAYDVFG